MNCGPIQFQDGIAQIGFELPPHFVRPGDFLVSWTNGKVDTVLNLTIATTGGFHSDSGFTTGSLRLCGMIPGPNVVALTLVSDKAVFLGCINSINMAVAALCDHVDVTAQDELKSSLSPILGLVVSSVDLLNLEAFYEGLQDLVDDTVASASDGAGFFEFSIFPCALANGQNDVVWGSHAPRLDVCWAGVAPERTVLTVTARGNNTERTGFGVNPRVEQQWQFRAQDYPWHPDVLHGECSLSFQLRRGNERLAAWDWKVFVHPDTPPRAITKWFSLTGPGATLAELGRLASFTVQAREGLGVAKRGLVFRVFVTSAHGAVSSGDVVDHGNGTYTVSYTVWTPGPHSISVILHAAGASFESPARPHDLLDAHINGSPFAVNVLRPGADACVPDSIGPTSCARASADAADVLCNASQSLAGSGHWLPVDMCQTAGDSQGKFQGGGSCSLVGANPATDRVTHTWAGGGCSLLFHDSERALRCFQDKGVKRVIVIGTSTQRTLYYDLVDLLQPDLHAASFVRTKDDLRHTVPCCGPAAAGTIELEFRSTFREWDPSGPGLPGVLQILREVAAQQDRDTRTSSVSGKATSGGNVDPGGGSDNGGGTTLIVLGVCPQILFNRFPSLVEAEQSADMVAAAAAEVRSARAEVLLRGCDGIVSTPFPGYARYLLSAGMTANRVATFDLMLKNAAVRHQVPFLNTGPVCSALQNTSHDTMHQFSRVNRADGNWDVWSGNVVSRTLLQLVLNWICQVDRAKTHHD